MRLLTYENCLEWSQGVATQGDATTQNAQHTAWCAQHKVVQLEYKISMIILFCFRIMDDHNGNVIENKTAAPLQEPSSQKRSDPSSQKSDPSSADVASKQDLAYGWGKIRPKYLKFLSSPVWFIVVFCVYALLQGSYSWKCSENCTRFYVQAACANWKTYD